MATLSSSSVSLLEDRNSDCLSILATVKLRDYLSLIDDAYQDQGGLEGQRAPITTKSGLKIRTRLVDDLKHGAVIPPIVVGAVCPAGIVAKLKSARTSSSLVKNLKSSGVDISIIDGMQRTTALLDAGIDPDSTYIRVEIWIAKKVESLIYRMLVLNTGQVPWDLKRQLDTLYRPIVSLISSAVPNIRIFGLDETFRRSQAGEYRSTRIVELFLAFSSRSIDVDIKERVAEEFARIDMTEATSQSEFMPLFVESIKIMVQLDEAFDRSTKKGAGLESAIKVKNGRDIFTSSPGTIGFIVAVAEILFGAPGFDYSLKTAKREFATLGRNVKLLVNFLQKKTEPELLAFLDLGTLNQVLAGKTTRIGEFQRTVYRRGFSVLLTKTAAIVKQDSMGPCWQAR